MKCKEQYIAIADKRSYQQQQQKSVLMIHCLQKKGLSFMVICLQHRLVKEKNFLTNGQKGWAMLKFLRLSQSIASLTSQFYDASVLHAH